MTPLLYDEWVLALCIWREARGESVEAMRGISSVIHNRALDARWPNTLAGVITQPKQFSSFNSTDANVTKFPEPGHPVDWKAFEQCVEVAAEPAQRLGGANHYHSCAAGHFPSWHDPKRVVAHIGPFWFLRL